MIQTDATAVGTITELQVRKQRYKLTMFTRLYRILWLAVLLIGIFFVVSTLSFSSRLAVCPRFG
jgi:sensor histidine kinase YesM